MRYDVDFELWKIQPDKSTLAFATALGTSICHLKIVLDSGAGLVDKQMMSEQIHTYKSYRAWAALSESIKYKFRYLRPKFG